MKKIKSLWEKSRDLVTTTLSDAIVEYPNIAMTLILIDVFLTLAIFLSMGSDAPLRLNN